MTPPVATAQPDRILLGVGAMLLGMAAMTTMDATAKWLGEGYAISQIVFFRNLFALIPVLVIVWRSGGPKALRTQRKSLHLLRATAILVAIYTFFYGLRFLALAEAVAIAFLAPLFVTALSVPILGERVGPRRWAAVVVGFAGALIMIRPGAEAFQWQAVLPAIAALGYALAMLLTRRLARSDTNASILFHGTWIGALFAGAFMMSDWRTPPLPDLGLFAAMGLIGGMTTYWMTLAYRHAPAALVAPFEYSALIWGVMLGWLIWRELPDPWVWVGAAVITLSGLYILHRETRGRSAPAPRPR